MRAITPKNCDISVKKAIQVLSSKLDYDTSPTFVGLTLSAGPLDLSGKLTAGSFASPLDVTATREYGAELHYSGNNYDVTGIRSRAQLVTTDTTATALGGLFQAANNDGINAGVLMGFMAEAIGKSTANASTITTMRGGLIGTEWGALDTITNLKTLHIRGHSLNAAGAGSFGTGYALYIENEAVGGNGQAYDAGIYFKGTNLSGGNYAFVNGIDLSGATISGTDIILTDGVINDANGRWGIGTNAPQRKLHIVGDAPHIRLENTEAGGKTMEFFAGTTGVGIGTPTISQQFILYSAAPSGALSVEALKVKIDFGTTATLKLNSSGRNLVSFDDDSGSVPVGKPSIWRIESRQDGFFSADATRSTLNFWCNVQGGGTYFAPLVFKTNGDVIIASVNNATAGNVGISEVAPETLLELTHATPYITLHNSTEEDIDGGGESRLIFKREDGAGTETAAGQIEVSHDGIVANNQLGKMQLSVNTGAALVDVIEIDSSGNTKIGDGGTTNYLNIDSSGRVLLVGTAQTWEDIRIVPGAFQFPGVADPTLQSWQPGGAGATYKVYKFLKNDEVHFTCQVPHNYKEGSDLKPHLHWTPCDRGNEEDGNTVGWKIDYSWANTDAEFASSTTVDLSNACSGRDDQHEQTDSGTITGTNKTISGLLQIRLYRSDTGTDDTWVGATAALSPAILEFDLHYEIDSLGSDLELVKDAP